MLVVAEPLVPNAFFCCSRKWNSFQALRSSPAKVGRGTQLDAVPSKRVGGGGHPAPRPEPRGRPAAAARGGGDCAGPRARPPSRRRRTRSGGRAGGPRGAAAPGLCGRGARGGAWPAGGAPSARRSEPAALPAPRPREEPRPPALAGPSPVAAPPLQVGGSPGGRAAAGGGAGAGRGPGVRGPRAGMAGFGPRRPGGRLRAPRGRGGLAWPAASGARGADLGRLRGAAGVGPSAARARAPPGRNPCDPQCPDLTIPGAHCTRGAVLAFHTCFPEDPCAPFRGEARGPPRGGRGPSISRCPPDLGKAPRLRAWALLAYMGVRGVGWGWSASCPPPPPRCDCGRACA